MENNSRTIYDTVIAGAGAAGLFYAANDAPSKGHRLILEKTEQAGRKLLISGNGMCNISHAGSIKDFAGRYGENGGRIRGCLFRYSNRELMRWLEDNGVPLTVRKDGKVFPESLSAKDILSLLLRKARENCYRIRYESPVTGIAENEGIIFVKTPSDTVRTRKLVIAAGGASFPETGSDGTLLSILERDLRIKTEPLRPALAPVYVENYRYRDISGVSFEDTEITLKKTKVRGPLLFTHRSLSGPAALHMSQYLKAGDVIRVNFLSELNCDDVFEALKSDCSGNRKSPENWLSLKFHIPKAFSRILCDELHIRKDTLSSLSHKELRRIAEGLTGHEFTVSGTGGFKEAMVTKGGVSLSEINLKDMSLKKHPGIYIIGETADINGDTGGYNLQYCYSSAKAALKL